MRTDTTLTGRRPPHRRLVVDTKFSATTLSAGPYGVENIAKPSYDSELSRCR